jgi:iron complex transport system ATP-binding protein
LLRAADVSFTYGGANVLAGVSLAVRAGELTGVLGPNGSGKTTLLKLLAGTLAPSAGTVSFDGVPIGRIARTALARRIAVVPQELQLAFDYTVLEIALMGRYPHLGPFELEGPDDVAIARRALEATGTWPLARRPFATLSGGEKQRVVIASALAQFEPHPRSGARDQGAAPPQVLLLDEPTASLDVHYQVEVASLLRRLNRQRGLTILVSTHDLNFAASVCRDLVLLRDGKVLTAGPTERVLTPDRVRALYGVDAHVSFHEVAGHLTVVPLPPQEPFAGDVP